MIIPLTKEELKEKINQLEDEIIKQCLHFEKDAERLVVIIKDFKKELGV